MATRAIPNHVRRNSQQLKDFTWSTTGVPARNGVCSFVSAGAGSISGQSRRPGQMRILYRSSAGTASITWIAVPVIVISMAGCAARRPVTTPPRAPGVGSTRILDARVGLASYYGKAFHGKIMASGARFDMNAMVAAHPTYPFGTIVRVTNLLNRRSVELRILDRGPAGGPRAEGVIIDVSQGAARALGFVTAGRARVRIEVLRWGK
jgi:rare lipoprotein A